MMLVEYYERPIIGKGMGVFSKNFIPKGTLVWKLSDIEIYTREEYESLSAEIKKDIYPENDHYVRSGGKGDSWNHSCDANTWWTADDELSARRDIQQDEEITYDYATTDINPEIIFTWDCKCGSTSCRKRLHWDDILKPEVYERYKGYIPSWVEKFVHESTANK